MDGKMKAVSWVDKWIEITSYFHLQLNRLGLLRIIPLFCTC